MKPLKRLKKTPKFEGRGKESDGPMLHPDHPRPVSRRQFLGQGFITGAATIAAPSMLSMLGAREAAAQASCSLTGAGAGLVPFIAIDLGGGANIAGSNVSVGGPGGQEDPLAENGYETLGLPLDMTPLNGAIDSYDRTMNLRFHFDSALMRGILDRADPVLTLPNVEGVIVPSRSANDTQNNPLNPMYGIARYGADGGLLRLIGSANTESGGRSMAPASLVVPEWRPTKIDRPDDVTGLVDTGKLPQLLGTDGAGQVADAIQALSALKVEQLNEDAAVKDLVNCAYQQSNDLITLFGSPDALDPLQDIHIVNDTDPLNPGIFTMADFDESEFRKTASVMKLVCEGHAGAGTIEFGGYDYHGGTRSRGELKDFTAGQCIGACIEYAERNPLVGELMIYLFSDGSLSSDGQIDNSADGRGKGAWQGDNSNTAAAVMLVYRKTAKPDLETAFATTRQIGHFRTSGSVETSANPVANNPEALAQLVILNYMALHGQDESDFNAMFPGNALGTEAANLIAFTQIK